MCIRDRDSSTPALGCAVAYPMGVVGVILAVLLIRKVLVRKEDLEIKEKLSLIHIYNQFLYNTSCESFRMEMDVQRMQQAIINLMSNADKFTKQGKITLDFSVNEETQMAV